MQIAEADVETERAGRYLAQLSSHIEQIEHRSGHSGPRPHVERTETRAVIGFGWGRCVLEARSGSLHLRVEADGEDGLLRVQEIIGGRLERFGRRDGLTVTWGPAGT